MRKERIEAVIESCFRQSIELKTEMLTPLLSHQIMSTGLKIIESLSNGNKVIFAGNGGSFADSQHLAAELVSRFLFDRGALPGIALGTNSSNMSAIGNDYGYETVFSRELSALAQSGDIFIPITTSGNSQNLIKAVEAAEAKCLEVIALTGKTGGALDGRCECIKVPSTDVPRIQECHILIGHILCQIVEEGMFGSTK